MSLHWPETHNTGQALLYHTVLNSTVSQALAEVPPRGDGLTAWASIERFCQGDRQLLAHGRDRVGHVAFGTDRGRVGIGNGRKGQVFCGASGLRGGKSRSLEDQESVGCDAEAGVMMESPPASPL